MSIFFPIISPLVQIKEKMLAFDIPLIQIDTAPILLQDQVSQGLVQETLM